MLNSLIIQNFRCLEDLTFNHLARVNLLVGRNNVGKSTVLEALRIYAGNANQELLKSIAESHNEQVKFRTTSMNDYFYYDDLLTNRTCENGTKEILIGENKLKFYEQEKKIIIINAQKENIIIMNIDINLSNAQANTTEIPCGFIPTQFISMEELEYEWNEINLTDNENIVNQALQLITPDFQRLAFDGDKSKRWVKVKLANNPKPVPLKSLGDGMLRILQIAIKLVSAQGGFLLIDEFENGLHYSVQEKVWDLLFKMAELLDVQVFVTTHSLDCVKSFCTVWEKEGNQDKGSFHRLFLHSIKNQIDVMPYQLDALDKSIELDIEVR